MQKPILVFLLLFGVAVLVWLFAAVKKFQAQIESEFARDTPPRLLLGRVESGSMLSFMAESDRCHFLVQVSPGDGGSVVATLENDEGEIVTFGGGLQTLREVRWIRESGRKEFLLNCKVAEPVYPSSVRLTPGHDYKLKFPEVSGVEVNCYVEFYPNYTTEKRVFSL